MVNLPNDLEQIEKLILLILGKAKQRMSVLHLQIIIFLLWRFHPTIRELTEFEPHKKGPYSKDVQRLLKSPTHYHNHWKYIPPQKNTDKTAGGHVELTKKGKTEYTKISETLENITHNKNHENKESIMNLLTALDIIIPIYTRLEWDELLLLIYTTEKFKKYLKKSELSQEIKNHQKDIIKKLIQKSLLPESKKDALTKRVEDAVWI